MPIPKQMPKKISLVPKKHHGFQVVIFILGCFVPPLAVAVRFGIGKDFFLNCFLCICGYIPSHIHNFYIQNIRDNTGKKRTPKWATKYGLVDDSEAKRRAKKSQWKYRFDERNTNSTWVGADLAEGEEGPNFDPERELSEEERARRRNEGLWGREEEEFYNDDRERNPDSHWHYPANFDGTNAAPTSKAKPSITSTFGFKKSNKDRRAQIAAYAPQGQNYGPNDRYADTNGNDEGFENGYGGGSNGNGNGNPLDGDIPEWGRDYGAGSRANSRTNSRTDNPRSESYQSRASRTSGRTARTGRSGGSGGARYSDYPEDTNGGAIGSPSGRPQAVVEEDDLNHEF